MKKKIIIALIYLSGCFVSYILSKEFALKNTQEWNVGDRTFALVFSAGSWLTASATTMGLCVRWFVYAIDNDAPAKW